MNLSQTVCRESIYASGGINKAPGSENSVNQSSETASASRKPSFSTPTPTCPRSSAPQSDKETCKLPDVPPTPPPENEVAVPEADIPVAESTPNMLADVKGEEASVLPSDDDLNPRLAITECSPTPKVKSLLPAEDSSHVTERSCSPTADKPSGHDVLKDERVPSLSKELHEESLSEVGGGEEKEVEENYEIDRPEGDLKGPLSEPSEDELISVNAAMDGEGDLTLLTAEPTIVEDNPEEPEEDKPAGIVVGPAGLSGSDTLVGDSPLVKPSEASLPVWTWSEATNSSGPTLHEDRESVTWQPVRTDDDPLTEATFGTTSEGDKPLDPSKQVECESRVLSPAFAPLICQNFADGNLFRCV